MPGSTAHGWFRTIRRAPVAVWAITVLFGLLLVWWSLLAPLGRAPDEAAHADLVFQQATGGAYPRFDDRQMSTGILNAWAAYTPGPAGHRLTPESAPSRSARKTFDQFGGAKPAAYPNQMPQHPPLYYQLTGAVLRVERAVNPADDPLIEDEWLFLRLLNAAMVLPLPLLAWAAARRLGAGDQVAVTAAVVPLTVPQLFHVGAAINNDNLLLLLCGILAVLVAGVLRGDARWSRALVIGIVTGLALLTKAFALGLLPWIALAYAYRAWRDRRHRKDNVVGLVVAGATASLIGGWWYLDNLVRYGKLSPSVLDPTFAESPAGFHTDPMWYGRHFVTTVIQRFWGDFGYYEAPLTRAAVVAATVVVVVAVVLAFIRPAEPSSRGERALASRGTLAVFVSLFGILAVIVAYNGYGLYRSSGTTPFMQGRYLFGAMVPFAVVVAIGLGRVLGRWSPLVVLTSAGLMQVAGVRVALRAWWAEPDASLSRAFDALLAWSPIARPAVYALLVGVGVAGIAVVVAMVRAEQARSGAPTGAAGPV